MPLWASEQAATSAMRKAGASVRDVVWSAVLRAATQAAKVAYLMPHCLAKTGALRLLRW